MQVGDVVYALSHKGERIGTIRIVGETRVSWLVSQYEIAPADVSPTHWAVSKLNKKELAAGKIHSYKATRKEAEDTLWLWDNRYPLSTAVGGVTDVAILKQIAELIGYEAKP